MTRHQKTKEREIDNQQPAPKASQTLKRRLTEHSKQPSSRALEILRRAGMRVTRPRLKIIDILIASAEPLNIEGIIVRGAPEKLDFSTVFRTLNQLDAVGLVRRVHLGRASSHYEIGSGASHHDHITCNACGRITPLPSGCPVEDFEKLLGAETGFSEISHSLEFFGICPTCKIKPLPRR